MLEVVQLLMKNRSSDYGRNFCGNVEMQCIVKSALSGGPEYRAYCRFSKRLARNYRHAGCACRQSDTQPFGGLRRPDLFRESVCAAG